MKIEQLRYFLEVARYKNITKAADILDITPSAINYSISALERELGRRLFIYKGNGVIVTAAAKMLIDRAEQIIHQMEYIRDELAAPEGSWKDHYRLTSGHFLSSKCLIPAVNAMQKKYPQVSVVIDTFSPPEITTKIVSRKYDLGLVYVPSPDPRLASSVVLRDNLIVTVRKGHPIMKVRPDKRLDELKKYDAAIPKISAKIKYWEFPGDFDDPSKASFISYNSAYVAAEILLTSNAWTHLPCWIAQHYRPKLVSVINGKYVPGTLDVVWSKDRVLPQPLKYLIKVIKKQLKKKPLG